MKILLVTLSFLIGFSTIADCCLLDSQLKDERVKITDLTECDHEDKHTQKEHCCSHIDHLKVSLLTETLFLHCLSSLHGEMYSFHSSLKLNDYKLDIFHPPHLFS